MRRFRVQLPIHLASLAAMVALCAYFVPRHGLRGAAVAMFLAYVAEGAIYAGTVLYRRGRPASPAASGRPAAPPQPVRVLHVVGPLKRGGMEIRTVELLRHVDRGRFEVDFCSLSATPAELDAEARSLGAKVHLVPLGLGFARRFRTLLRDGRYDVVHSHLHQLSGLMLRLAAKEGVPVRVAHYRSATLDFRKDNPLRRAQRALLRRWIARYATDVLGVSEGALGLSWRPDWRNDPRCRVIYNGIDTAPYALPADRAGVRAEFSIAHSAPLVTHVGRMVPPKNHPKLLEVFADVLKDVPDAYLLIAGRPQPDVERAVRERAAALGIADRVRLAGERADVPRLLKASDLLLFPSLHEGLPGAVLEARAAGVPVLASDLPSLREIASHLPGVHLLPLSAPPLEWQKKAAELLATGRADQAGADPLADTVFTMRRCVDAHCGVWQRGAGRT
jgi:glycosyltransferase involved in cell wall biosynthesis